MVAAGGRGALPPMVGTDDSGKRSGLMLPPTPFQMLQSKARPDPLQLAMATEDMRQGGRPPRIIQGGSSGAQGGFPTPANRNNPSVPPPRTSMEDLAHRTEGMSRQELLQSEPLWAKARDLSESEKMSFKDAFQSLVVRSTGFGLTSAEWSDIAAQAMKFGIR